MADLFKPLQCQATSLYGAGSVLGSTTVILSTLKDLEGNNITMTDIGSLGYGTIEPGASGQEEAITFTGITQNANGTATLTGVKNQLGKSPYTQTAGLLRSHAGGTVFVLSNTAGFYDSISGKNNDETITGTWIFPDADANRAQTVSDVDTTEAKAFVTLGQMSRQAISGASNASETVKGIVELATSTETGAGTSAGATGARLVPPNSLLKNSSAGAGDAGKIPVLDATGKLDQSFIDLTDAFTFASTVTLSSTTNLNGTTTIANSPSVTTAALTAGKVVSLDGSAKLPAVDGSQLTLVEKIYQQTIPYYVGTETASSSSLRTAGSLDGNTIYTVYYPAASQLYYMHRFAKDLTSGMYCLTTTLTGEAMGANITELGVAECGNYVYVSTTNASAQKKLYRYDKADFANETSMTISGTAYGNIMWSDGTNLYIWSTTHVFSKYTISGTTATYNSDITYTTAGNPKGIYSDGISVYMLENAATDPIRKYALAGGAASATKTMNWLAPYKNASLAGLILIKSGYLGYCKSYSMVDGASITGSVMQINPLVNF